MPPFASVLLFMTAGIALNLTPLAAQRRREPVNGPQTSVLLGAASYDFSGTGTAVVINAGFALRPLRRILIIEPGLGYLTYKNDFQVRSHWIFPEVSVQVEAPLQNVRPYLGGGAGAGIQTQVGRGHTVFTLHVAGGVRIRAARNWGIRLETRLRSVDPFEGRSLDFGAGVFWNLF